MTQPTNDLEARAANFIAARNYALRSIAAPKQDRVEVREIETVTGDFHTERGQSFWRIEVDGYCADFDYEEAARNFAAALNQRLTHTPAKPDAPAEPAGDAEQCVMVCPQCDGEGFYADGLDEAACSTECTRCGSNGWIVDLAALRSRPASDDAVERVARALSEAGCAASWDNALDGARAAIAALRDEKGDG